MIKSNQMKITNAANLVKPTRFAIVNPESLSWGQSDWFIPHSANANEENPLGFSLWIRKSNGLFYGREELVPSIPKWKTDEGFRRALESDKAFEVEPSENGTPSGPFWDGVNRVHQAFVDSYA